MVFFLVQKKLDIIYYEKVGMFLHVWPPRIMKTLHAAVPPYISQNACPLLTQLEQKNINSSLFKQATAHSRYMCILLAVQTISAAPLSTEFTYFVCKNAWHHLMHSPLTLTLLGSKISPLTTDHNTGGINCTHTHTSTHTLYCTQETEKCVDCT